MVRQSVNAGDYEPKQDTWILSHSPGERSQAVFLKSNPWALEYSIHYAYRIRNSRAQQCLFNQVFQVIRKNLAQKLRTWSLASKGPGFKSLFCHLTTPGRLSTLKASIFQSIIFSLKGGDGVGRRSWSLNENQLVWRLTSGKLPYVVDERNESQPC